MLLSRNKDISETIISLLAAGPMESMALQTKVQESKAVTKQAFYKSLRALIADEIILKNKRMVLLNNAWVNKLHGFIETIDQNYRTSASLPLLKEGESLVYHFRSIASLDALWMHYFYLIAKQEKEADIVMYNPHEFWSLVRFEEEQEMYKWLQDNKRISYTIIGNNSELDKNTTAYIKKFGIEMMYEEKPSFKETYYYAVIGNYVLTTVLDQATTRSIHALYAKYSSWSKEASDEIQLIISKLKKSKVIIEKNKKKAEKLHRMLVKKYFTF